MPEPVTPSRGRRRRAGRDRRGRGLRGPLAPRELPVSLTRAERFDELVRTSLARLEGRWADELAAVEVAVEDVPAEVDGDGGEPVPLGHSEPATPGRAARLVVYRRPVEARARSLGAREDLVHLVVVGRLAELLGLDPAAVDPEVGDHPDDAGQDG